MGYGKLLLLFIFLGQLVHRPSWGEDGEELFQELGCSSKIQTEEATRMGKSYPNSFCFIQHILGEGKSLFDSQVTQEQMRMTLHFLRRECKRNLSEINADSKELFQRACSFPHLYKNFLDLKDSLTQETESIEVFSNWNMTDLLVGNYAQVPFSEGQSAVELVAALLVAEKQMIQSANWVSRLVRHLVPTGINVEVIGLRMQAALVSYSKPRVLLTLFTKLQCDNMTNKAAQQNCQITKDILYFNIRSILDAVPSNLNILIKHVSELSGQLISDKTFKDRDLITVGKTSYTTRPEIERLASVIQMTNDMNRIQRNDRFEFVSWDQDDLRSLREGIEKMNLLGGSLETVMGEISGKGLLFRFMSDLVLVAQIQEVVNQYTPEQGDISQVEFALWRNNYFIREIQHTHSAEFTNSLNLIRGFMNNFLDPLEVR